MASYAEYSALLKANRLGPRYIGKSTASYCCSSSNLIHSSFCLSEEKKSDAEKKEALKNLVQDKKRAKDLDGVKRLARYYTGYYTTGKIYF